MDDNSDGDSDDSDYEYTAEEDVIDEGKYVADQTEDGRQESVAGSETIQDARIIPCSSCQKRSKPSQMEVVVEEVEETKEGQDYNVVLEEDVAENVVPVTPVTPTSATPSQRGRQNDIPCDVSDDDTVEMEDNSDGDSDDSDYEYTAEEDVIDEGKCVADEDSSHPSYAWCEPGQVAPSEPCRYCYSNIDALDHMKN
jgi:hypothetical protein